MKGKYLENNVHSIQAKQIKHGVVYNINVTQCRTNPLHNNNSC